MIFILSQQFITDAGADTDQLQKSDSVAGGTPALEKALAGEELSYGDGVQLISEENVFLL